MSRQISLSVDRFALAKAFVISRGSKTEAAVITVTISQNGIHGRGECVPYARYGETLDSVRSQIEAVAPQLEAGLDRIALQALMPPGAARNAVDCALWDLEAKLLGIRAITLAGLARLSPVTTAYTISVGTPDEMGKAAALAADRPLLKIKLAGDGDAERLAAVCDAAPDSTLIVDANEAWAEADLEKMLAQCAKLGVAMVEQPLPASKDSALAHIQRPVPVCADESVHDRAGLAALRDRYDAVNIKLDKTGGLTEALEMVKDAQALGFGIMVGCMVGSSLAMAPALLLCPHARFVDLDGPLLLAQDRDNGLRYVGSVLYPPEPALWG